MLSDLSLRPGYVCPQVSPASETFPSPLTRRSGHGTLYESEHAVLSTALPAAPTDPGRDIPGQGTVQRVARRGGGTQQSWAARSPTGSLPSPGCNCTQGPSVSTASAFWGPQTEWAMAGRQSDGDTPSGLSPATRSATLSP